MKTIPIMLLLLCATVIATAQSAQIKGTVTDDKNVAVGGATVTLNTGGSTTTDAGGNFSLATDDLAAAELTISHVNYQVKTVKATADAMTIVLTATQQQMSEVVVIGYGTQKKRNVTGAVSTLNANFEERPVQRVDQALVGQLSGVRVRQTTGALGKGLSVQVRGTSSISAGNEPLYVIDGFPLTPAAPNASGNYANGNPLDNINPNDIESIQVLKDAASAAIYGSRAGNGVVLITTKKGKTGKASISINSVVGYMERSRGLDMLSPQEWIDRATEMINAQWVASGANRTADQTNEQRRQILGLAPGQVNTSLMTDDRWFQEGYPGLALYSMQDEIFRKGLTQNHQLSASGGTENVKYFISGNYNRQEGMVKFTDYTSYSARANVEVTAIKKLKFGVNISPTYSINHDPGVEGKDNILHQALSFTPVQEDTMGLYANVGLNGQYRWSVSTNSPYAKLQYSIGETKRYRTLGTVYADYAIIPGLNLRTTVNLDNTDITAKSYNPYIIASSLPTRLAQLSTLASGSYNTIRKRTFVNENTISYNKVYNNLHDVSFVAGFTYNSDKIENSNMSSQGGFRSSSITTLNDAVAVTGATTESMNILLSYLARLQYGYDNKYLLSASIRRDGSSRFGANTKWGVFPSFSAGWRISGEPFMSGVDFISDLKIRASYGTSGNYNIPDYGSIATLGNYGYTFNGNQVTGFAPSGITNPDLSWEKSEMVNVGMDLSILRNRVSLSAEYYNKKTRDLLFYVPVLAVTGSGQVLANAGEVKNTGWEFDLNTRNVVGSVFQWNTNINLTLNRNQLISLPGGQQQLLIPSSFDISHAILRVGEPLYSIYVVKQDGILTASDIANGAAKYGSQVEGDPKYVDFNGDGVIDANDRQIAGHPNPDFIWGMTNTFKYKNFDLSVLVQGQHGGSIYSLLGRALGRTGQGFTDNALGFYRDRWRSASDPGEGVVGKAYSTFGRIKNTDWLYSSDYIRVRNVTLGYNLGGAFKNNTVIQGARLFITAENFWGYDKYKGGLNPEANNTNLSGDNNYPEAGDYGGLPLPRSLVLGINFSF